jgi:VanZ family protein
VPRRSAAVWRRYRHLIWAAAYCGLIVYGSLYPFSDWQRPHQLPFLFLFQPWPPYVTRTDVLTNVLAYLPLGFLLFKATRGMLMIPVLYGALLSFMMETLQAFVPGRVSSNLDVLTNAAGVFFGAVLAWWISRQLWPCSALTVWRQKWFLPGRTVNTGLLLLGLWVLSQWSLQLPSLVAGNLHGHFFPYWETLANPSRFKFMEALIYFLEIMGLGLFAATLMRPGRRLSVFFVVLFAVAVLLKLLTVAILLKLSVLTRLFSLEALVGLCSGLALLLVSSGWRAELRSHAPVVAVLAAFIAAQTIYWLNQPAMVALASGWPSAPATLLNITGLAFLISLLWPLLTLAHVTLNGLFVRRR